MYRYVNANPINEIDPSGLQGGSAPRTVAYPVVEPMCPKPSFTFNPRWWNRPTVCNNNNCYSYACNMVVGHPPSWPDPRYYKPQPGGWVFDPGTGLISPSVNLCSCSSVMGGVARDKRRNGLNPRPKGTKCPKGTYAVILMVGTHFAFGCDYHFMRQDNNGSWSGKCGNNQVGPRFPDPVKVGNNIGYEKTCGYYCHSVK